MAAAGEVDHRGEGIELFRLVGELAEVDVQIYVRHESVRNGNQRDLQVYRFVLGLDHCVPRKVARSFRP